MGLFGLFGLLVRETAGLISSAPPFVVKLHALAGDVTVADCFCFCCSWLLLLLLGYCCSATAAAPAAAAAPPRRECCGFLCCPLHPKVLWQTFHALREG